MPRGKFDDVRNEIIDKVSELLDSTMDYQVLRVASQKIAIPIVNANGDEAYLTLTFAVPTGSHDGEPYNGHDEAESYAITVANNEEKARAAAAKKAEKIAKDAAAREARKRAKEQRGG